VGGQGGFGEDSERRRRGGWKSGTETERGRKRKRAAHTVHMRDRPSAYEAAGIDQPKSATTPGVLLRALLFSARRAARSNGRGRKDRARYVGGGQPEKSMVEATGRVGGCEGGGGGGGGGLGVRAGGRAGGRGAEGGWGRQRRRRKRWRRRREGGMQGVPRPSPTDLPAVTSLLFFARARDGVATRRDATRRGCRDEQARKKSRRREGSLLSRRG